MKIWLKLVISLVLLFLISFTALAQKGEDLFLPLYEASQIRADSLFGYAELPIIIDERTILYQEGYLRRIFCQAPENRSPLEIIKNYEQAIKEEGGKIIFTSRKAQEITIEDRTFQEIFQEARQDPGYSTEVASQYNFPSTITDYLVAKIQTPDKEIYLILAAGPGFWAANEDDKSFYELIYLELEAMEMDLVTASEIAKGLANQGRIAIYGLYFDLGKYDVKAESAASLQIIADYLLANKEQKVYVVGHTDNSGDFAFNLDLSKKRAEAVIAKLVQDYGVDERQMRAFGAGPTAPLASNASESGRAKNRRVDIVEQ